MKYEVRLSFEKDLKKINDVNLLKKLDKIIDSIENSLNLLQIPNIKKIAGYSSYYRIRLNDYRLGIEYIDNTIYLIRFKHRKDIYKIFP